MYIYFMCKNIPNEMSMFVYIYFKICFSLCVCLVCLWNLGQTPTTSQTPHLYASIKKRERRQVLQGQQQELQLVHSPLPVEPSVEVEIAAFW